MTYSDDDPVFLERNAKCRACPDGQSRMYFDGPRCLDLLDPDRMTPSFTELRRRMIAKDPAGCMRGHWITIREVEL
jgi:hypothetical protein